MRSLAWRQLESAVKTADEASYNLHTTRHVFTPFRSPSKTQVTPASPATSDLYDKQQQQSRAHCHEKCQPLDVTEDTIEIYLQSYKPTVMSPPQIGATIQAKMQFMHCQLDSIGESVEVLNGLFLLGGGAQERLEGGACYAPRKWQYQHICTA